MTINNRITILYEQQKEPVFKQTNRATRKAHVFTSLHLQSEGSHQNRATEWSKLSQGFTHTQAKPFSPFLASTTKLRGGRFPLIGQGKLCVSGDFPHSNGIREGHEASLWVGCDNDSSNSAKGQILHLSKSLP